MADTLDPLAPSINHMQPVGFIHKVRQRFTRAVPSSRSTGEGNKSPFNLYMNVHIAGTCPDGDVV